MRAYISEAFRVLLANRMRSLLTTVGLIIGVAAIIAIQVSASGMAGAVNGLAGSLSNRAFYIFPKSHQKNVRHAKLQLADIDLVNQNVSGIAAGIPYGQQQVFVRTGHRAARLQMGGEADKRFSTAPIQFGRAIDTVDVQSSLDVCVISANAYTRLFPNGGDVTGESVYVGDRRYQIVGVLAKNSGGDLLQGINYDIAIPYTTYLASYMRGQPLFAAKFLVADNADIGSVEDATKSLLSQTHGGAEYSSFDSRTISGFVDKTFAIVGFIVSLVGGISLLVAGIGIMNIMLVSVTERTREIGIRKAIGARRSQILIQFMVEALMLSGVGCLIGMTIGLFFGWIVNVAFISKISGVTAPLPWLLAVTIAVGFATIVTFIFGTYPAMRAARLDPIEALRYE
ncbi:MAG: ABC transporter permease [Candidatus Eremiobacteraeota bacterium]|nr:ABC transporter permease [Candidatus Eremiobacteraeota bacterium]